MTSSSFPVDRVVLSSYTSVFSGVTFSRVLAQRDFTAADGSLVRAGDLGGWVESLASVEQSGSAWVGGNAYVFACVRLLGDALVTDLAVVAGLSVLSGSAVVCDSAFLWDTFVGGEWLVSGVAVRESFGL
jgi:hypothetical protein